MKIKLENENQKCTFAGFGINMLLEKGNYKVQRRTMWLFCSPYIHNKTTSFPEMALELLYLTFKKVTAI